MLMLQSEGYQSQVVFLSRILKLIRHLIQTGSSEDMLKQETRSTFATILTLYDIVYLHLLFNQLNFCNGVASVGATLFALSPKINLAEEFETLNIAFKVVMIWQFEEVVVRA